MTGTLWIIARELVVSINKNLTIDWTIKESVRANLRATVEAPPPCGGTATRPTSKRRRRRQ